MTTPMVTSTIFLVVTLLLQGAWAIPAGLSLCSPGISAPCTLTPHIVLLDQHELKDVLSCTGFDTGLTRGQKPGENPPTTKTGTLGGFEGYGGCSADAPSRCSTQLVTLFPDMSHMKLCYPTAGTVYGDVNGYFQAVLDSTSPGCDKPLKELFAALEKASVMDYIAILDANPTCKDYFEIVAAPSVDLVTTYRGYIEEVQTTCTDAQFASCADADLAARAIIAEVSPLAGNSTLPPAPTVTPETPPGAAPSSPSGASPPVGSAGAPTTQPPSSNGAGATPPATTTSSAASLQTALSALLLALGLLSAL